MENSPVPTNKPTFASIPLHSTNTIVAPSECRQGPGLLPDEPPQPGCSGLGRFSRVQLTAPTHRRCKPRGIAWGLDDADGWDVPFAPTRLHYGMPSCCRFRVVLPCCRTGIFSGEPPKVEFVHLKHPQPALLAAVNPWHVNLVNIREWACEVTLRSLPLL